MDDIDEIYAACIVEYARRFDDGVLTGPFQVIGKDARDSFNLPYSEDIFRRAVAILEEIKVLTVYRRQGMQTYYRVEAKKFDSAMTKISMDVRGYKLSRDTVDERTYSFLETFYDVGAHYLRDALDSYEDEISAIADHEENERDANHPIRVDSQSWTGLPTGFVLSEERRVSVVRELEKIDLALQTADLGQYEKSQARAFILSAKALAEAPEPSVDLIWEVIGRANSLAGVASFLVSLITLFMAAAS